MFNIKTFSLVPLLLTLSASATTGAEEFVVVGHPNTPKMDAATLEKVFTGKLIQVGGVPVTPVNVRPGSPLRQEFLRSVVKQDDEKYVAYWTVRRYIGKGTPPREVSSPADVIAFIKSNPGAVGYVEASAADGLNVILNP